MSSAAAAVISSRLSSAPRPRAAFGAGLDRQHSEQGVAGDQRQGGVGELARGAAQEFGRARDRDGPVDPLAGLHAVLAAEAAPLERSRRQAEVVVVGLEQVERCDAAARARGDEATQRREPVAERLFRSEDFVGLSDRVVTRGLGAQRLVLLCACDDLRVETRELLDEIEIRVRERVGAGAVVQVQYTENAPLVDERYAQRRLDVQSLAHDPEGLAVRLAAQAQRSRFGGDLARDAFADRHANLGPQFGLYAGCHPDAQLALRLVEQHQGAAFGARHVACDLEHAREQLVGVDRQVVRLDDLVERLQQLLLVVARERVVGPEQPRGERRDDLDAALGGLGEMLGEGTGIAGVDHRIQRRGSSVSTVGSSVKAESSTRATSGS